MQEANLCLDCDILMYGIIVWFWWHMCKAAVVSK